MSRPLPAWLEAARMAPSAHNTQPWRFKLLSGGQILVRWDPARSLPASDPTNRDLYLALGAAIESARLGAAGSGRCMRFNALLSRSEGTVGSLEEIGGSPDPRDRQLAEWLPVRRTARTPHLPLPIPTDVLSSLPQEAASVGCRLRLVLKGPSVERLAVLAGQATVGQFADAEVHAELWRWLRLDPTDPAYHRDGLTADCLNLRGSGLTVARFALPPPRMRWLVRLRLHHLLALDTVRLVRNSATMCLLTVPSAAPVEGVRAGQLLLRLWLMATGAGLSAHPVSALLDCAATVGPALSVFHATGEMPAALFRLGVSPPVAKAPRLPADELLQVDGGSD